MFFFVCINSYLHTFIPSYHDPKRRNSPEWRLFRALVRADVRGVIYVQVRNFLLLAWRERETRLNDERRGGRSRLIFTTHVRADGLAAVGRAAERARRRAGVRAV